MVRELEGFLFCYRLEWCFVIGWYVLCDCCLNFSRWRVIKVRSECIIVDGIFFFVLYIFIFKKVLVLDKIFLGFLFFVGLLKLFEGKV